MLLQDLLKKIREQKQKLIALNPKLKHFFVEIEIPRLGPVDFLPIRSFRDFCLFTGNPSPDNTTFLSSGSTNEKRAHHIFSPERLKFYAEKSTENFLSFLNQHGFDRNTAIVSLIPPPDIWKDSSLARMISMLKDWGFKIQYVDVENHPESIMSSPVFCLDPAVEPRGDMVEPRGDMIVFGTTFHHFLVAEFVSSRDPLLSSCDPLLSSRDPLLSSRGSTAGSMPFHKLAIIDTGGTKGRMITHSLSETQEILRSAYGNPKTFLFLSEYGMCELGSQAWSTQEIHDGTFSAANTLFPFSICLKNRCALPLQEKGFLGFIDLVNLEESYPAIITEDIGAITDEDNRVFRFYHRAPNASIKGCSLNVKENFKFVSKSF
jgi:hypothetical protein